MSPLEQFFLITGIIGVVAFIMAVSPFLQQIFGRPKIALSFGHNESSIGKLIRIYLMNPPFDDRLIKLRILKVFGVSRSPAYDVYIRIQVFNALTKELVIDWFCPDIGFTSSDKSVRVVLPASKLMTNVDLARWWRSTNSAVLLANRNIPLKKGTYGVNIGIGFESSFKESLAPAFFHVGKTENEMTWDKSIMNKLYNVRKWNDIHTS
jgi:hypothetical protein